MQTRYLVHPHELKTEETAPSVMALGYFDGVHTGHQKVIQTAKEIADQKGLQSAVMTFYPHPAIVLGNKPDAEYITPLKHKEEIIAALGIDVLYVVTFDKHFASLSPQAFIDQYIVGLNVKHVAAGFDFTYGHKGKGNMKSMIRQAEDRFTQTIVDKIEKNGEKISSTFIRDLIRSDRFEDVSDYLGHHYEMKGEVVHGEKRGRDIGFPTANIDYDDSYLIPAPGVYVVKLKVGGNWLKGVCSVGYKPTFHENRPGKPVIEVYLFDFNDDIYGEKVTVRWYKKLRDEVKFSSADKLIEQMKRDEQQARDYFRD
jgi:riboflavin kinase/FMN adenylyltransferase